MKQYEDYLTGSYPFSKIKLEEFIKDVIEEVNVMKERMHGD